MSDTDGDTSAENIASVSETDFPRGNSGSPFSPWAQEKLLEFYTRVGNCVPISTTAPETAPKRLWRCARAVREGTCDCETFERCGPPPRWCSRWRKQKEDK